MIFSFFFFHFRIVEAFFFLLSFAFCRDRLLPTFTFPFFFIRGYCVSFCMCLFFSLSLFFSLFSYALLLLLAFFFLFSVSCTRWSYYRVSSGEKKKKRKGQQSGLESYVLRSLCRCIRTNTTNAEEGRLTICKLLARTAAGSEEVKECRMSALRCRSSLE